MKDRRLHVTACWLISGLISVPAWPQAPSAPASPSAPSVPMSANGSSGAKQSPHAPVAEGAQALATDSASAPDTVATAQTTAHDNSFMIGNDDLLAVHVWKEPEVSQTVPVRSDGKISLPLIGELQASGRTPLQLENEIARKLATYISDPDVTVMVQQINSQKFNILGQIARPGAYSLTRVTTVLDAIALAGGFRDFAKQKGVYILRRNPAGGQSRLAFNYKQVIKGMNPEQNIVLQPGDTVVIP